jgi:hypothetical protein
MVLEVGVGAESFSSPEWSPPGTWVRGRWEAMAEHGVDTV